MAYVNAQADVDACQCEVQVMEEVQMEIANLKESFRAELTVEDFRARVHWL